MKPPTLFFFALGLAQSLPAFAQTSPAPASAATTATAGAAATTTDADAAYTKTITDRSEKIVDALGFAEPAKKIIIRDILVAHYRVLHTIDEVRDPKLAAAKQLTDKAAKDAATKTATDESEAKRYVEHTEFETKLAAELTPEQVDKVKDGLTSNALRTNYDAFTKKFPDLAEEQKKQILTWFTAARELAIDGGSSDEKLAFFIKYRGRVNNYLSAAGYDLKTGQKKSAN